VIGEVEMGGVFIPIALVSGIIGFWASLILRRILRVAHAYTFVWHAGLFDVASFVLLWAATDYFISRLPIMGLAG
jgi:Protein of unknown function (DUF1656)